MAAMDKGLALGALVLCCACGCSESGSSGSSRAGAAGSGATSGSGGSASSGSAGQAGASSMSGSPGSSGSSGSSGSPNAGSAGMSGGASGETLSERYPGDAGLADDPAVLFFDDFEGGWGKWDAPTADTEYLFVEEGALANAGMHYLRSTVTTAQLEENQYISASPRFEFPERVDRMFWRFHVRFPVLAPNPHHWVRVAAGDESYSSSGLANTVPPGDGGFWFDLDANLDDVFNFYVYWHAMRSGNCNDGTTTPGCAGDQGADYHYGNTFRPLNQVGFSRDAWFCVEMEGQVNQVGESDGRLALWVNDALVGEFGAGYPDGTWLRDQFHQGGCEFSSCTDPVPFEGFEFRTDAEVRFKGIFLDAYYERDTSADKRTELEGRGLTVSDEQTILYDDIVVATERIGCRK
jgi:PPE-repeat protein